MSEAINTDRRERSGDDTVLEIRDVEVTYNMSRGLARVLENVSLDIERGETLGIIGESGCGKSMFASSMMSAVKDPGVTQGDIIYYPPDDEPVNLLDLNDREIKNVRWEDIALVDQGAMNGFNPVLTMKAHFVETFEAHDVDKADGLERAEELIRDFNLDPERIFEAYQHELSGGEKQRVMLALSLVFDPEVLILDEPTAALDLLLKRGILQILYEIREEYDLTLVFISHQMPIVAGFADRVAVMYAFDIVELGDARDVLLSPEHPYTRLLLASTLHIDVPIGQTKPIEGTTPDPINIPTGCSFHPRCPISDDRCEEEDPDLRSEEGDDHEVACFYPDISTEQVRVPHLESGGE